MSLYFRVIEFIRFMFIYIIDNKLFYFHYRPMNESENRSVVSVPLGSSREVEYTKNRTLTQKFTFDRTFDTKSTQVSVFIFA